MVANYEYMPRAISDPDIEYPTIYCEFSQFPDKCRMWMEKYLPDEFEKLNTNGDLSKQLEASTKGRQVRGGKGTSKKLVKQQVQVFKTSRGKKKYTTSVTGLSTLGIDLKSASKVFGRKFATGSSVTGNGDEIIIQGDVKDELIDFLLETWPEIDENLIDDLGEMKR